MMLLRGYTVRIADSVDVTVWGEQALASFVETLARDGKECTVSLTTNPFPPQLGEANPLLERIQTVLSSSPRQTP